MGKRRLPREERGSLSFWGWRHRVCGPSAVPGAPRSALLLQRRQRRRLWGNQPPDLNTGCELLGFIRQSLSREQRGEAPIVNCHCCSPTSSVQIVCCLLLDSSSIIQLAWFCARFHEMQSSSLREGFGSMGWCLYCPP